MVAKTIARTKKPEIVKIELLSSLRERDRVEEQEFNINNIIDQWEAIEIIIKMRNKKTITYEEYKGRCWKRLESRTK